MDVLRSAGPRPLVRAGLLGALVALGVLWVQLRLVSVVLPVGVGELTLAALGLGMAGVAAVGGGAVGAWQAAAARVPDRASVVVVGAVSPVVVCGVLSVVLGVLTGADPVLGVAEVLVLAGGGLSGAWLFPRAVVAVARLAGQRGQTAVEYLGIVLVVAAIVAALGGFGPQIAGLVSDRVSTIPSGGTPAASVPAGTPGAPSLPGVESDVPDPASEIDGDGDGLSLEEERALGTDDGEADSDGDGVSDADEYLDGTDPAQGVAPLTEENLARPWERVGLTEEQWREMERAIVDEINPGGLEGFLLGNPAQGIQLDEDGELVVVPTMGMVLYLDGKLVVSEVQEASIGGGLVKGLAKLLGAGGRGASSAVRTALGRLSPALRAQLGRVGLGGAPGRAARLPQDIAVNPKPPGTLSLNRSIGRPSHNAALQQELRSLPRGARDIRVNQQQVNAAGQRVGTNRPDLQYTVNGKRYYVEFEGPANPRGAIHQARIGANDPAGAFQLRLVP